jgi:hypothetical protein
MATLHGGAHGVAEVAQHMPAVGDLHGVRRALPRSRGIGTCPIPCDDFQVASVKVVGNFVLGEAVMDQTATAVSGLGSASIIVGMSSAIASTCI